MSLVPVKSVMNVLIKSVLAERKGVRSGPRGGSFVVSILQQLLEIYRLQKKGDLNSPTTVGEMRNFLTNY